jgi:putative hydrolase of the HAD superfamily
VIDLDDTLVATTRARRRAGSVVRAEGIDPRAFAQADRRWWRRLRQGECSREEMWVGRWRDFGLDAEAAQKADQRYRQASGEVNRRRGAGRLLAGLRTAGMKTVILSDGDSTIQREKIARTRLEPLVDAVLVGGDIRASKPNPVTFHTALERIGSHPAEAVAIGDLLNSDVKGALLADLLGVFWLTSKGTHTDPRVFPVPSLDAVLAALVPG